MRLRFGVPGGFYGGTRKRDLPRKKSVCACIDEEGRRLCYVGVTRRKNCSLVVRSRIPIWSDWPNACGRDGS